MSASQSDFGLWTLTLATISGYQISSTQIVSLFRYSAITIPKPMAALGSGNHDNEDCEDLSGRLH